MPADTTALRWSSGTKMVQPDKRFTSGELQRAIAAAAKKLGQEYMGCQEWWNSRDRGDEHDTEPGPDPRPFPEQPKGPAPPDWNIDPLERLKQIGDPYFVWLAWQRDVFCWILRGGAAWAKIRDTTNVADSAHTHIHT